MENEILNLSSAVKSSFNGFIEAAKTNQGAPKRTILGGLMRNGKFYSAEVLAVLIKTVAGTFGRLSYTENRRKKPRFSTVKFKTICTDLFVLQYYTGWINDAEQIIKLTLMMEQILGILTTFEKGGKRNG